MEPEKAAALTWNGKVKKIEMHTSIHDTNLVFFF